MLYNRDYSVLTPDELVEIERAKRFIEPFKRNDIGVSGEVLQQYYELLPVAYEYYNSEFPNNKLGLSELKNKKYIEEIRIELKELIEERASERKILNFIRDRKAYFLIGSILRTHYDFGHHGAYLFREFELPPDYIVDFLLIGRSSGGLNLVFVELEGLELNITTKDGGLGATFRKGISQVDEWNTWLEANYDNLRLNFERHLNPDKSIPRELYVLDKTRINYVVVAGRRSDFTDKTYRLRRKFRKENGILLLHYDNLLDAIEILMKSNNY